MQGHVVGTHQVLQACLINGALLMSHGAGYTLSFCMTLQGVR